MANIYCSDTGPTGRRNSGPSTGRIIVSPNMGRTIRGPMTDRKMGRKWARVEIVYFMARP